jgi:DNA-binding GntR family transcriptional regulator
MGVAEHTPLFGCDRLLEDAAGRRVLHRLYLPLPVVAEVPALEENPFRPAGEVYTLLADGGNKLAVTDYVTARNPNPDDAATLHISDGAPMLVTRRITTSADGQPLAMEEAHRSADDTQLTYPVTLPRRR